MFTPAFTLLLITGAINCHAQNYNYVENSVYIYNFTKYTNWPQKKTVIHVGIIGNSPEEDELRKLFSKKTNSHSSYDIKKITAADAGTVDVIIVAQSEQRKLKAISELTAHMPILLISEKEDMNWEGACISFYIDEDDDFKTGYQLSLRNCKARGLSVSDEILNNAVLTR